MLAFILPPVPSLWAVALLAVAYGLYKTDHPILATLSAGAGVFMLIGWIMSILSWGLSMALFLIVAALVGVVAIGATKKVAKSRKEKKAEKKALKKSGKKSSKEPLSLNQSEEIFDINSLISSNDELLQKINRQTK